MTSQREWPIVREVLLKSEAEELTAGFVLSADEKTQWHVTYCDVYGLVSNTDADGQPAGSYALTGDGEFFLEQLRDESVLNQALSEIEEDRPGKVVYSGFLFSRIFEIKNRGQQDPL